MALCGSCGVFGSARSQAGTQASQFSACVMRSARPAVPLVLIGAPADGGSAVTSVTFNPDGTTLAAGNVLGHVGLWNIRTRRRTAILHLGNPVTSIAFRPGSTTLAVSDGTANITLWDTAARRPTTTLAEPDPIATVSYSRPQTGIFMTGDTLGDLGIWNASTGHLFATLTEGSIITQARTYALSPDGKYLAASRRYYSITLLQLNLSSLSLGHSEHLICSEVRENLTRDEWRLYLPGQPY